MTPRKPRSRRPWTALRAYTQRVRLDISERGLGPYIASLPRTAIRKFRHDSKFRLSTLSLTLILSFLYFFFSIPPTSEPVLFALIDNGVISPELAFRELKVDIASGKAKLHPIENGHLLIDPSLSVHPIEQLMATAQDDWETKLKRQSRTLRQAVEEYKRRYRRAPPLGFDKWWNYVVENNIVLPDEYDRINNDIDIYHHITPAQLRTFNTASQTASDTFTVSIVDGKLSTFRTFAPGAYRRAVMDHDEQLELLKPIIPFLPDLNATFSIHDLGHRAISWQHRLDLQSGTAREEGYRPKPFKGFAQACPPDSPMAKGDVPDLKTRGKMFSHTTKGIANICQHPEYEMLHGSTAGRPPSHGNSLFPEIIFALSKTSIQLELQGASLSQWTDPKHAPYAPWEKKHHRHILWRGSGVGQYNAKDTYWRDGQRFRLVNLTHDWGAEEVDVILPRAAWRTPDLASSRDARPTLGDNTIKVWRNNLSEALLDFGFANIPVKAVLCSEEDGTCDVINKEFPYSKVMDKWEAVRYRYIMDVDGNGWSGRFQQLLLTGSLIFKSSMVVEWWHDRLQPWVHYIPINVDYSDLYDAVAYTHDERAREIAEAGRAWTIRSWRKVDLTAYNFRLYLEWARLLSDKREDFVYHPSMERVRTG